MIAIDNTLIHHDGTLIEDVGWYWDHVDQQHVIAHDELFANDVHPSGKHYPLDFRRFRKQEHCVAAGTPFKNHTALCLELIDWVVTEGIPGEFSFDSSFTNAAILNHIDAADRTYVGDLKANRIVTVDGHDVKVSDWIATHLLPACRTKITVAGVTRWYFTKTVRIPKLDHAVRSS